MSRLELAEASTSALLLHSSPDYLTATDSSSGPTVTSRNNTLIAPKNTPGNRITAAISPIVV
eukprot:14600-Heterococcus_DN1.PRE.2